MGVASFVLRSPLIGCLVGQVLVGMEVFGFGMRRGRFSRQLRAKFGGSSVNCARLILPSNDDEVPDVELRGMTVAVFQCVMPCSSVFVQESEEFVLSL